MTELNWTEFVYSLIFLIDSLEVNMNRTFSNTQKS